MRQPYRAYRVWYWAADCGEWFKTSWRDGATALRLRDSLVRDGYTVEIQGDDGYMDEEGDR